MVYAILIVSFCRWQNRAQRNAEQCCGHDCDLLTSRLPADVKAFVPGRRNLGQINGNAAQFHSGRETLQKPAKQTLTGASRPVVAYPGVPAMVMTPTDIRLRVRIRPRTPTAMVGIGSEHDRSQRPHTNICAESH